MLAGQEEENAAAAVARALAELVVVLMNDGDVVERIAVAKAVVSRRRDEGVVSVLERIVPSRFRFHSGMKATAASFLKMVCFSSRPSVIYETCSSVYLSAPQNESATTEVEVFSGTISRIRRSKIADRGT